jgi:hypothetical protein
MILLEQHMELGSLGITFGQLPLYAPPLTPIQALHNKYSLQKIKFTYLVYSPLPTQEPSTQANT